MARLSIHLQGSMQVALDGEPITGFATDKVRALLAYLAVEDDRPHRRESLAGLLWADHSDNAARTNLRRALTHLRQALDDHDTDAPWILADRKTIRLNSANGVWVDINEFTTLVAAGTADDLEAAAGLYRGPFMEGFSLGDCPAFEEWALLQREKQQRDVLAALGKLADHYEVEGDVDKALVHGRRQVELDPWREPAHRQIMRLLASSGRRSDALSQYEVLTRTLAADLGAEPEAATTHLRDSIRRGELDSAPPPLERLPQVAAKPLGECPYRGLSSFREADAPFFFGREAFVSRMLEAVLHQPVVAVIVGSSGAGKSSAVFAGLLPQLRADDDWLIIPFRPGAQPFASFASAVIPALEPDLNETSRLAEAHRLSEAFRRSRIPVGDALRRAVDKTEETSRLLLVMDQTEELYTLCPDPDIKQRFLNALLDAVDTSQTQFKSSIVLLAALRADFMGHALAHRRFADTLQDAALLMGPMSRDELRAAIERPAELQGAAFEAGLVDRLLDDVGTQPGNLPMLEFALTLLWDRNEDGRLTHRGYEAIGRVEGALARYANEVLADLPTEQQRRARHVFTQLVRPGEGTDDTRRVAARTELDDAAWQLVQYLADKRLVVTGNDSDGQEVVEVVHEALIQHWGQLQHWMEEDRSFRSWQEGLRTAQRSWTDSSRDPGALLRGAPLVRAESWLEQRRGELSAAELDFIETSIAERSRAADESERRRKRTLVALVSGLVLAIGLVAVALTARTNAQREADANRSLVLAANATAAMEGGETDLALALALAAVDLEDPPSAAARTLAEIGLGVGTRSVFTGHSHAVRAAAFAPDGSRILSGSCSDLAADGTCTRGELILWGLDDATELARLDGHTAWVNDVAFSPDGATAISASEDGRLILWSIETGATIRMLADRGVAATSVAISPDGTSALGGFADGTLAMWDVESGEPLRSFEGHSGAVTRVSFAPAPVAGAQGATAMSASADQQLILWDLITGEPVRTIAGHEDAITDAAIHPDGKSILSVSGDFSLRAWDVETGLQTQREDFGVNLGSIAITPDGRTAIFSGKIDLRRWDLERFRDAGRLAGHVVGERQAGNINAIEVSRDGRLALSAGSDGTVRVWNLSGQLVSRFLASGGPPIDAVAVDPDGSHLLSGAATGELALWDAERGEAIRRFGGDGVPVSPDCLAFNPAGSEALVCSEDPTGVTGATSLVLWDVATGAELRRFEGHVTLVRALAYLPDGTAALAGSQSVPDNTLGDLILWDLESGAKLRTFDIAHDVANIAVSGDGTRAVSGSVTGFVAILWDLTTGEQIRRFEGHTAPVLSVGFGPDDKTVVTGSFDGTLRSWDVETGEIVTRFAGHDAGVFALDVSPDGRFVISGSDSGNVIVWDFATGDPLLRLASHRGIVFDVAFHPDGRRAYSAGIDGKLIEWSGFDLSLEELIDWIDRNRYVRDLTCEESAQYDIATPGCTQP